MRRSRTVLPPGNRVIGHLADLSPPFDARSLQVAHDRRAVHLAVAGECVDRLALVVTADQVLDLSFRQPTLDRV